MKKIHLIFSGLVILVGVVHIIYTTQIYDSLNFNALWFVSGGLWSITLGLFNLVMRENEGSSRTQIMLLYVVNLLSAVFIVLAIYVMKDPSTYLISIIVLVMGLSSLSIKYPDKHKNIIT